MNNLLRTLSNNPHVEGSPPDLMGLLAGIREIRAQDSKSADQFYDALEGLLHELRVVTAENRDAEAFLKPVGRSEYPDYHEIISHPMDLQTMLKKVKSKSYKNKLEFSDDLNLIWDNCYRYNSTPDHPLRACASRLRVKANTLLKGITDRSERIQPRLNGTTNGTFSTPPPGIMSNGKPKFGLPNGKAIVKPRIKDSSSPFPSIRIPPQIPGKLGSLQSTSHLNSTQDSSLAVSPSTPSPIPLHERTAIFRTPEVMSTFMDMDRQLDDLISYITPNQPQASTSKVTLNDLQSQPRPRQPRTSQPDRQENMVRKLVQSLNSNLRNISDNAGEREREKAIKGFRGWVSTAEEIPFPHTAQSSLSRLSQDSGLKRKRSKSLSPNDEQRRKKVKVKSEPLEAPTLSDSPSPDAIDPIGAALDVWWKAVGSNHMIASGVPSLVQQKLPEPNTNQVKEKGIGTGKRKREVDPHKADPRRVRKKIKHKKAKEPKQTMLSLMNSNIATLRRLRTAHNKYARLVQDNKETAETGESQPGLSQSQASVDSGVTFESETTTLVDEPAAYTRARERPWKTSGEVEAKEARGCLRWTCSKVLEHSTFQGTSSMALETLSDITSAYIMNLGNTLHLLMDKFSQRMSSEELILHALFENGVPSVADLEYYIKDDVLRHGTRLQELEKKTNSALEEVIKAEILDDDAVFGDEADDDNFASGLFGDLLGEDYLGFEASGVLSEFNLGNMSIPKRLWKGKKSGTDGGSANREKGEPPLPYPLPPSFVPLRSDQIDNQIGLLQDFYRSRLAVLAHPSGGKEADLTSAKPLSSIPAIAVLPPPTPTSTTLSPSNPSPLSSTLLAPPGGPVTSTSLAQPEEVITLPDDVPDLAHTKVGPIGQIILPSTNPNSSSKKKAAAKKDGPGGDQGDSSPNSKNKGGSSKKSSSKSQDKDGKEGTPGTTTPNTSPAKKKKPTPSTPNGSAQSGSGTPSPTKKAPAKSTKGSNNSPTKGPSNSGSNGPVLIPPV